MTKFSTISALAMATALRPVIPAASFADGDSPNAAHSYQETKAQRDVAALQ